MYIKVKREPRRQLQLLQDKFLGRCVINQAPVLRFTVYRSYQAAL